MISSGIWILFYLYEYFAFMLVLSDVFAHCFVFPARFQQGNTTVLILVRRNCCKLVWIVHNSIKHKVWGYLIYLRCLSIQRLCCQRQATHTRVLVVAVHLELLLSESPANTCICRKFEPYFVSFSW